VRDVREAFRGAGLRHTRQREAIYSALGSSKSHPTAEELHERVRQEEPGLSLATVYNTLEALCDSGLCRRLPSAAGVCRFDADVSEHVHVALPDGRVLDAPPAVSRRLLEAIPGALCEEIARGTGARVGGLVVQLVAFPQAESGEAAG
jgi:Fe2+ or Zn2+ uptake regulation protein